MSFTFNPVVPTKDPLVEALGINNTDDIVGFSGQTMNIGFSRMPPNTFTEISPTGAAQTQIVGLNNRGLAAGFFVDAVGATHGLIYNLATGAFKQQDETGTAFNQLLGVNDSNVFAGYSSLDPAGQTLQLAYTYNAGTNTYLRLDDAQHNLRLPGNVNSQATGIDNAGDVVGFFMPTATTSEGFILTASAASAVPLEFPGSTFTQALGINNLGQVTGFYNDAAGTSHGFIWSNGNWTTIDVPGASATTVNGINDAGHIVGFSTKGPLTTGFESNIPVAQLTDNTTGANWQQALTPYSGPVSYLTSEFIDLSSDNLNMTATTPNVFLHSGAGEDGLTVTSGNNILDGGTGSNFLIGGTGNDTFYLDDRNPSSPIFSTIVNFHSGDNATVWGITQTDFSRLVLDNQGAAGAQGVDLIFSAPGHVDTSFVLAGYTSADLSNGRLSISYGKTADVPGLPGSFYMTLHAS